MKRRIMHLDMDAFFAAVEQADNPELRGKPVIVGGSMRGVVCAASYEARRFGVHSAMPVFQAIKSCPKGIFLPVRMYRYKQVSSAIMEILHSVSPMVEQVSIDEAYVDITGTERLHGPSYDLACRLKATIREAVSLSCSIGIAPNKFIAKIASDFKKPDGLMILEEDNIKEFLADLPVGKIPGVGKKTGEQLHRLGVFSVSDVLKFPAEFWTVKFGKWGTLLYLKAQGLDNSTVEPSIAPKSISAERTFPRDTDNTAEIEKMLLSQAEEVGRELRKQKFKAKTVTLKIKLSDFKSITRSRTMPEPFDATDVLFVAGRKLLEDFKLARKIRLIGIGASNFAVGPTQLHFGSFRKHIEKQERLDMALDQIHSRFTGTKIIRGQLLGEED